VRKGRLQPGRLFLVDTAQRRIVADDELRPLRARGALRRVAAQVDAADGEPPPASRPPLPEREALVRRQQAFGYTFEEVSS